MYVAPECAGLPVEPGEVVAVVGVQHRPANVRVPTRHDEGRGTERDGRSLGRREERFAVAHPREPAVKRDQARLEVTGVVGVAARGYGVGVLPAGVEVDGDEVVAGSRSERERRAGAETRRVLPSGTSGVLGTEVSLSSAASDMTRPDIVERLLTGAVGGPNDGDAAAVLCPVRDDDAPAVGGEVEGDRFGDAGRTRGGQPHRDLLPGDDGAGGEIDQHERARVADPVRNLQREVATVG